MRATIIDLLLTLITRRPRGRTEGEVWHYDARAGIGSIVASPDFPDHRVVITAKALRRAGIPRLCPTDRIAFTAVERPDGTIEARRLRVSPR